MKTSILITGGCGFIGANLTRKISLKDYSIRILDDLSNGVRENINEGTVELVVGDIRDFSLVKKCMEGISTVVHLAAHTRVVDSLKDPSINFDINAYGTLNLLRAAKEKGVKKFILASTGGAILGEQTPPINEDMVAKPLSPYGASKLAAEGYCSAYYGSFGINTIALRFSNVYGCLSEKKESVVAHFYKKILKGETLTIYGDGHQTRDFIFVEDLCDAILLAIEAGEKADGEVFQIASGKETSILELLKNIKEVTGRNNELKFEPIRKGEVIRNYCSIKKARKILQYSPKTSLKDGLVKTWDWFCNERK